MTIFLDRVKLLAKEKKISMAELEREIEVSKNTSYTWKTKVPNSNTLEKVADYFDVSADYLLGRTDLKRYVIPDERFQTFAAHIDDDATEEEIEEILAFIEFKKNLKKNK